MIVQWSNWGASIFSHFNPSVVANPGGGKQNFFNTPTTNLSKSSQMSPSSGYLLANISHFLKLWCNICSFEATSAFNLETHYAQFNFFLDSLVTCMWLWEVSGREPHKPVQEVGRIVVRVMAPSIVRPCGLARLLQIPSFHGIHLRSV